MNFLHMSFHTNSAKGKNFIFEQILCHNICTYWFNFEFLILNTSNFLLWTFFIYPSFHANSTKGLYFTLWFFPSMAHLKSFCTILGLKKLSVTILQSYGSILNSYLWTSFMEGFFLSWIASMWEFNIGLDSNVLLQMLQSNLLVMAKGQNMWFQSWLRRKSFITTITFWSFKNR